MGSTYCISDWRGWLFPWVSLAYLTLIFGLPTCGSLLLLRSSGRLQFWAALVVPLVWVFGFLIVAGLLSLLHQFAVVPGKFRRDVNDRMYFHRRLYGLCWTAVYYHKPAYYLCLSVPFLKWATFRLFGYRGSMNFTVYPDTWIRDLPLLDFEDGVYVSNRATLATNIVLSNGFLLVDRITFKRNALIGHLSMTGPGVVADEGVELGVGAAIGIRTKLGSRAFIGPCAAIEHGVRVGSGVEIGPNSYVGTRAVLGDGLKLPGGSVVATRAKLHKDSPSEETAPSECAEVTA
jgi:acetyltransferase-like isoleucine patch superfamily enzyme